MRDKDWSRKRWTNQRRKFTEAEDNYKHSSTF